MKKSKNQRVVGWTTLGAGLLLSGIGILVGSSGSSLNESNTTATGVILLAGAVSGIVSIPFMIMATVNKHKAKLILDNKKTGFGVPSHVGRDIAGVTMVIPIGK
ncbi:MAG TPA: hypothetical protein VK489_02365 [Ferruginibacter sp.]|nr:hypothetical protein [Ferruginibacter sp.]